MLILQCSSSLGTSKGEGENPPTNHEAVDKDKIQIVTAKCLSFQELTALCREADLHNNSKNNETELGQRNPYKGHVLGSGDADLKRIEFLRQGVMD